MVSDLNFPVKVMAVPTVRESDGLALSSRNHRLTAEQRRIAPVLFRALTAGQLSIAGGERQPSKIKSMVLDVLQSEPDVRVEYLDVVDSRMQPVDYISSDVRLAAAIWLGSTRLIDNVFCAAPEWAR
jgi:pantoate--beta-alanine ligase